MGSSIPHNLPLVFLDQCCDLLDSAIAEEDWGNCQAIVVTLLVRAMGEREGEREGGRKGEKRGREEESRRENVKRRGEECIFLMLGGSASLFEERSPQGRRAGSVQGESQVTHPHIQYSYSVQRS